MVPKTYLTTGLRHLPKPRLLEPGETFIVRYKNSTRNYKADAWIGVIMPPTFGPSRHVNRRPVGAEPLDGEWQTHPKDRMYPMYLPARNMYRWVGLQDIFVLNEKMPNVLQRAGRQPDAKIWDDLMEIIRTDPVLEFWKDMALQEQGTKGKRGKELRIILPSGYEDLVSCEESDTESEAGTGDEDETEEKGNQSSAPEHPRPDTGTDTQPGSSKVQATVKSFSDARAAGGSQWTSQNINKDGKSTGFSSDAVAFVPNTGFNPRVIPDLPPFQTLKPANSSNSTPPASMSTSSTEDQDMHSSAAPPATAATFKVETDTNSAVPDSAAQETTAPSVFDMTIRQALQHIVLGQSNRNQLIDVFRGAVVLDTQPEFVHIRSYFKDGDFLPRVIELDTPEFQHPTQFPTKDSDNHIKMRVIGDQMNIGQNYRFHNVTTTEDLDQIILILGRVYLQARRFGLDHLVYRTTFKLQIAWNCYPYLYQCKPLLEVAVLAFAGCTQFTPEACDYLQRWLIHLLAETMDLFTYNASQQFWELMRDHSDLQDVVLNLRFQAHCHNPGIYGDTRALLASRGVI